MPVDSLVTIGADLSQLRRELAKLPNMSDAAAQKTLISFEKMVVKAEKAAKKANKSIARSSRSTAKEATKTAAAMNTLEDAAGDSDSAIMGLSGGLSLRNPKLGEAAGLAGDFGAGVERVVRLIGKGNPWIIALTVAATAAAAAYSLWAEEQAKHKAQVEASTNALKAHHGQLVELRAAQEKLAVTLGDMTESERALNQMRREQYAKIGPMVQELTAQISIQGAAVDGARAEYERLAEGVKAVAALTSAQRRSAGQDLAHYEERAAKAKSAYDLELSKMKQLNDERQRIIDTSAEIVDAYEAERIGADLMAAAAEGQAQVDRERAERERELARLAAEAAARQAAASAAEKAERVEMLRLAQQQIDVEGRLSAIEIEGATTHEAAVAKVNQKFFERMAQLDELAAMGADQARLDEQMQLALVENENELALLRANNEAGHLLRIEERAEAERLAAEERLLQIQAEREQWLSMAADGRDSIGSVAGMASDTAEQNAAEAMERSSEFAEEGALAQAAAEDEKAAKFQETAVKMFKLEQVAAIGKAGMDAAMAITDIWAKHAANPVLAVGLTAAAATATGVQIAAIKSQSPPTFDIGGVVGSRARDSQPAMLRAGEGVLTAQGVGAIGGAAGVHAANRGAAGGSGVVALPVYNHFGRFFSDELARPGAARRAMIAAGARSNLPGRRGY